MLPKDLLKYAKKLSPQEIKQAIMDAMKEKPKSSIDDFVMQQLQQMGAIQSISTNTRFDQYPTTTVTYLGTANMPLGTVTSTDGTTANVMI